MVPDPDKACYGLEYFCFEHDGLWDSKDEELIELAKRELIKIGLAQEGDVVDGCVVRQKKSVSGLRRRLRARMSPRFVKNSMPVIRICISLAATACTNTTIRITP